LRWHHPSAWHGQPGQFIPIAESSGLIVDIGEWVFQQAAQPGAALAPARCSPDLQISVNKSPVQFHSMPKQARTSGVMQLQAMGLPGDCMAVEITEGLLLDTQRQRGPTSC